MDTSFLDSTLAKVAGCGLLFMMFYAILQHLEDASFSRSSIRAALSGDGDPGDSPWIVRLFKTFIAPSGFIVALIFLSWALQEKVAPKLGLPPAFSQTMKRKIPAAADKVQQTTGSPIDPKKVNDAAEKLPIPAPDPHAIANFITDGAPEATPPTNPQSIKPSAGAREN